MKKKKLLVLSVCLITLMVTQFTGCDNTNNKDTTIELTTSSMEESDEDLETRVFIDSVGREVVIPVTITKVAPSGVVAQLVLYTLAPDTLVGVSGRFSEIANPYLEEKYRNLPVFGQFYGKNVSLNMEAVAAAEPQIIIDIGEAKDSIKEEMDNLQQQLGIPVIFIEATLDTMASAYETLGDVLGEETQAGQLADYFTNTLQEIDEKSALIAQEDRVHIYYGEGANGLQANPAGSTHADVIDRIGAVNVADIEVTSSASGNEVSIEQILLWEPDVLLFGPDSIYGTVYEDEIWQDLIAVKENKVYEVPDGPYNFMGRPPSINRIIGLKWLGNLLYPDVYSYDMIQEVEEFYQLFYHYDLSEKQAKELMLHSTFLE